MAKLAIAGTWGGLGEAIAHDPKGGRYTVTTNATTRFGYMSAGLLEEADATGIAAGDRIVKVVDYNTAGTSYRVALAHDISNTDTHIYHKTAAAGAWTAFHPTGAETGTGVFAASLATDIVVWKDSASVGVSYLIVAFGTTAVWHYNAGVTGAGWITSTTAGVTNDNSDYMTKGFVQETGLGTSELIWAVSPASGFTMTGIEIYNMSALSSPPVLNSKATIDPDLGTYVTSITTNDLGDILIGTRNKLYSFDEAGLPVVMAGPFEVPNAEAGAQASPLNFERYVILPDSSVLYIVEGYKLLRIRSAADPVTERSIEYAPRDQVKRYSGSVGDIPRVNLPISAIARCGEWVVVALTYASGSAPRTLANQPGGTTLLQNTLTDGASEIYVGRLVGDELVWWGSELTVLDNSGNAMRVGYMWYEVANNYLYLSSADSESASHQQRRCYFFTDDPYGRTVSGSIKLSAGTPIIEFAPFDLDSRYSAKGGGLVTIDAQSLSSTATCTVAIRPQPDYDTSSTFTTLAVFSSAAVAERGVHVGRSVTFDKLRVKVALGAGSGTAFPRFNGGEVELLPMGERQSVGAI